MKIIKIILCLLAIHIDSKELEQIFQTRPWTAIIPVYGDMTLTKLANFLTKNRQTIDSLKDINNIPNADILELRRVPNSLIRKDIWLIHNLLSHIRAQRRAALLHSCITLGSLASILILLFTEDQFCTGNINKCDYSIDKTIPITLFWVSAPLFFYKFILEPDIASHEKEFAELLKKLRND